jgi:hypothetical protein
MLQTNSQKENRPVPDGTTPKPVVVLQFVAGKDQRQLVQSLAFVVMVLMAKIQLIGLISSVTEVRSQRDSKCDARRRRVPKKKQIDSHARLNRIVVKKLLGLQYPVLGSASRSTSGHIMEACWGDYGLCEPSEKAF